MRVDRQDLAVGVAEDRLVVAVPDLAGDREHRLAQLGRGGLRMGVQEAPDPHVDQRHAADLVGVPEEASAWGEAGLGGVAGDPQHLEVALLEDEGEGLGEGGVGDTVEPPVVDAVEREHLLGVVAELVHRRVVALEVHPPFRHAGAQVRLVLPPHRLQGVAGAAGRIDLDVVGEEAGALGGEAELPVELRQPSGESAQVRVALLDDAVELLGAEAGARLEARVPEVERLERPAEPLGDQGAELAHLGRAEHRDQQRLDLALRDLAVAVEAAVDEGGGVGAVGIDPPDRLEDLEQPLVAVSGSRSARAGSAARPARGGRCSRTAPSRARGCRSPPAGSPGGRCAPSPGRSSAGAAGRARGRGRRSRRRAGRAAPSG